MSLKALSPVIAISILLMLSCSPQDAESSNMPVTTDSDIALGLYNAGMMAFDQVKMELAYHSLAMAVKEDPNFFMASFWLYFMMPKNSQSGAEKALNVEAELCDGEIEIQKALKYLISGQNEKVIDHLRTATSLYPGDPHIHKILYILQFQYLKDIDGALESMNVAIENNPDYPLVYNQMGYALMDNGEYEMAEKAFDTYIRLSPNVANPYDSKGDFFMSQKRFEEAYESYMKAYEIDSGFYVSKKKAAKAKQLMEEL